MQECRIWLHIFLSQRCVLLNVNALLLVRSAEETPVTLQVDMDNLFQLDKLVLSFKVPRSLFEHNHISFVIIMINYLLILFVCLMQMPSFLYSTFISLFLELEPKIFFFTCVL